MRQRFEKGPRSRHFKLGMQLGQQGQRTLRLLSSVLNSAERDERTGELDPRPPKLERRAALEIHVDRVFEMTPGRVRVA